MKKKKLLASFVNPNITGGKLVRAYSPEGRRLIRERKKSAHTPDA